MSHPRIPADRRDEHAADRDDAADRRDDAAHDRDDAAAERDIDAVVRDQVAGRDSHEIADHLQRLCEQILARLENATVDPAAWPDLTPAALARLEAHTAEQRRLAGLDRAAVQHLLDQLHLALGRIRQDRYAAAADRRAAARDRHDAAANRTESGQDREHSADDRSQGVIEREQVDPRDVPASDAVGSPAGSWPGSRPSGAQSTSLSDRAIATSRLRISDSQEMIARARRAPPPGTDAAPSDTPHD